LPAPGTPFRRFRAQQTLRDVEAAENQRNGADRKKVLDK
jgi:hypothetical protein